jgi:hypothetical protein
VQRENIGVAKLRDGTRLVRVGDALAGELAVWRYGEGLVRRRTRHRLVSGIGIVTTVGLITAGSLGPGITVGGAYLLLAAGSWARERIKTRHPLARLTAEEAGDGEPAVIDRTAVAAARLTRSEDGALRLWLGHAREVGIPIGGGLLRTEFRDLVLNGEPARRVLTRAMVVTNEAGATRDGVRHALEMLGPTESPAEYVMRTAREGLWLTAGVHTAARMLALEMALHEETERRALDGELAALEEMWRQAEGIAAIADRLPELPATDAPRT